MFRLSFRVRAWPLAESCVVLRAIQRFGKHPVGDIDFSYILFAFSMRLGPAGEPIRRKWNSM